MNGYIFETGALQKKGLVVFHYKIHFFYKNHFLEKMFLVGKMLVHTSQWLRRSKFLSPKTYLFLIIKKYGFRKIVFFCEKIIFLKNHHFFPCSYCFLNSYN